VLHGLSLGLAGGFEGQVQADMKGEFLKTNCFAVYVRVIRIDALCRAFAPAALRIPAK
jgi:hypothetical protein